MWGQLSACFQHQTHLRPTPGTTPTLGLLGHHGCGVPSPTLRQDHFSPVSSRSPVLSLPFIQPASTFYPTPRPLLTAGSRSGGFPLAEDSPLPCWASWARQAPSARCLVLTASPHPPGGLQGSLPEGCAALRQEPVHWARRATSWLQSQLRSRKKLAPWKPVGWVPKEPQAPSNTPAPGCTHLPEDLYPWMPLRPLTPSLPVPEPPAGRAAAP